jgi:hypothetical protein
MTARQRIEQLTHTWYGFTVFAAVASVVTVALWPFSPGLIFSPAKLALAFVGSAVAIVFAIGLNIVGLVIGLFVVSLLGRALLNRSAVTRLLLVVLVPVLGALTAYAALQQLWSGITGLALSSLLSAAVSFIMVSLYVRSWRVLTSAAVKDYTRGA